MKKVLIVGGGGREHAIAWAIRKNHPDITIFAAPGNAGMAEIANRIPMASTDIKSLLAFAKAEKIDLTIIGPEGPLALGIVDEFLDEGLKIFGPDKFHAQLESSKEFGKKIAKRAVYTPNVHIPYHETFNSPDGVWGYTKNVGLPRVLKADGLAGGKGAYVVHTEDQLKKAIHELMVEKRYGAAANKVLVEEFIEGEEVSFFALIDGRGNIAILPPAKDHKVLRQGEPNTGGVASISPPSIMTPQMIYDITAYIVKPISSLRHGGGLKYKGLLYVGLMIEPNGRFNILEFNCRFGDPETQAILPLLKTDFLELILATCEDRLHEMKVETHELASAAIVAIAKGYPEKYLTGETIYGLDTVAKMKDVLVFHAGTDTKQTEYGKKVVTNGGRVLCVTGLGKNIDQAVGQAYAGIEEIVFRSMDYPRMSSI